jgi:hypothetical protein
MAACPAALHQPLTAQMQLVSDQARNQINGCHGFGLSLAESSFQRASHAAQPQLS